YNKNEVNKMQGTMKAVIYNGIKDVSIENLPIPQIGDDDILVKNLRAGICGTDIGAYMHGGDSYAIFPGNEFGHEMVSVVVEKGENVADDIQIGDYVFINPMTCKKAGASRADTAGAFSEYVNVENAKTFYNVYVLDKSLELDTAVIIEPLSVGTNGAIHQGVKLSDKVVVLGAGTIGLSAAAGLLARGLKNVCVVDINDWRLAKAKEIGALTVNNKSEKLLDKLKEYFGTVRNMMGTEVPDVDLYVDAAGFEPMLQEVFANGRQGTKYSIVAVYGRPISLDASFFIINEARIEGSCGYNDSVLREVIDHLTQKKTAVNTIVTSKFKLKDFQEAIETAVKADNNIKVIIDYEA
ncbi:zinc-binding dehydrogenase, partial [Clostridium boliviensis]